MRRPGEESPELAKLTGLHHVEFQSQYEETPRLGSPTGPHFLIYKGAIFSTLRDVQGGRRHEEGSTEVTGADRGLEVPPVPWFPKWVPQRHRVLER